MSFHTVDSLGFKVGEINPMVVSDRNRASVVEAALPNTALGFLERWRWVDGQWMAIKDYRGHTWYNPDNTPEEHRATAFDDAPPADWAYWVPGENKIVSIEEQIREEWKVVRARRTVLLKESDWVVTKAMEQGDVVPLDWVVYRQALRDITLQADPFAISWPVKPI